MAQRTCSLDGCCETFEPRTVRNIYCSKKCSRKAHKIPKAAEPCADANGCDRPAVARGLCTMHWKRAHGKRTTYERVCDTCGDRFRSLRPTGRFCDDGCKGLWYSEHGVKPPSGDGVRRSCDLPEDHPVRLLTPISYVQCAQCASVFVVRFGSRARYCDSRCRWRAKGKRRSKRHLSKRQRIFERDAFICWICDEPTSPRYSVGDIWSPTIDHLVPQSFGGTDDDDNLATAHMWCNSVRGASWDISPAA